jgi:hypothetical protein
MIIEGQGARCSSMIPSGEGCSLSSDEALGRRVLAVQQRRTRAKGARCPATTRSAEGWIYQRDPPRGRKKEGKGRGVECLYDDRSSDGCCLFQPDTPDRSGEGCSLFHHDTLRRRVLAVPRRRSRAKCTPGMMHPIEQANAARCSSMIPSGEGCSLSSEDALGRRELAVQRRRARAKGARCPATTHSAEGWI